MLGHHILHHVAYAHLGRLGRLVHSLKQGLVQVVAEVFALRAATAVATVLLVVRVLPVLELLATLVKHGFLQVPHIDHRVLPCLSDNLHGGICPSVIGCACRIVVILNAVPEQQVGIYAVAHLLGLAQQVSLTPSARLHNIFFLGRFGPVHSFGSVHRHTMAVPSLFVVPHFQLILLRHIGGLAQNTPVSPRLLQVLIASPKQVPQLVVTQLRPLPAFKAEPMKHIYEQPLDLHPERRGHLLKVRILGKPGKIFLRGRSEVPPTFSRKSHYLTTYLRLCMLEHIV